MLGTDVDYNLLSSIIALQMNIIDRDELIGGLLEWVP